MHQTYESDVKTDENTWSSQPSYLHLTARSTTKYPSEIVVLENSENGSTLFHEAVQLSVIKTRILPNSTEFLFRNDYTAQPWVFDGRSF